MNTIKSPFLQRIIFFALTIINVMNVFFGRGMTAGSVLNEEQSDGERIYIQLLSVVVLCIMSFSVLKNINYIKKWYTFYKPLFCLGIIVIIYIGLQQIFPDENFSLAKYVKLLMNIAALLFCTTMVRDKYLPLYIGLFILTYVIQLCWKIFISGVFLSDTLGAGDTASIGLVFLVPFIIVFYKGKLGVLLLSVCAAFTLLSLRRTSILGYVIILPFIWPYLKRHISKWVIFLAVILICIAGYYLWSFLGDLIIYRFDEMINGSDTGSRGSGRDGFWLALWEDFWMNGNILFGNGMGSIATFYYNKMGWYFLPHAHNDFLELLYTFGICGLFVWLSFLLMYFKYVRLHVRNTNLRKVVYASLVAYLFVGFVSGTMMSYDFLPLAMSLGLLINERIVGNIV